MLFAQTISVRVLLSCGACVFSFNSDTLQGKITLVRFNMMICFFFLYKVLTCLCLRCFKSFQCFPLADIHIRVAENNKCLLQIPSAWRPHTHTVTQCLCVCFWSLLGFNWSVGIIVYQVIECAGTGAIFKWKGISSCVCVFIHTPTVYLGLRTCVHLHVRLLKPCAERRAEFLSVPPADRWIDDPIGNQW